MSVWTKISKECSLWKLTGDEYWKSMFCQPSSSSQIRSTYTDTQYIKISYFLIIRHPHVIIFMTAYILCGSFMFFQPTLTDLQKLLQIIFFLSNGDNHYFLNIVYRRNPGLCLLIGFKRSVYISSCIMQGSKLSGFQGTGWLVEGGMVLCFKHIISCGLSLLTALEPPLRRKPLISSLFCYGPDVFAHSDDHLSAYSGDLWCAVWGTDPKPYLPSACWSSSLNNSKWLFLFPRASVLCICPHWPFKTGEEV